MSEFNIIGGGIAGLVCAWELSHVGHQVTVYERNKLGGVVSSHELAGIKLDAGAESFAIRTSAVQDLFSDLGIADKVVAPVKKPAWIFNDNATYPTVPGVFGIPVNFDDVIEILSEEGLTRARLDERICSTSATFEPISIGKLVELRMGKEVVEKLVAPVIAGVHAANPYDLDSNAVIPGIQTKLKESGSLQKAIVSMRKAAPAGAQVLGLKGGMRVLSETLVKQCRAQGVQFVNEKVTSLSALENPIVATGINGARRLLTDVVNIEDCGRGADIVLVSLIVKAPALNKAPRGTGVLVDESATKVQAKALTHASAKWEWLANKLPKDTHVIRLSYGRPDKAAPEDSEIVDIAISDAQTLLATEFAEIIDSDTVHWPQGIPFVTAENQAKLAEVKSILSNQDNVHVVGAWVAGTGLASVVKQAREVSQKLIKREVNAEN
ncbi:MAG: FAD-dependent oxidoreductase [Micrococcaceae bacterium]